MGTVRERIENWRKGELRGASQVNEEVLLIRYNEWLHEFEKALLEFVANQLHVTTVNTDLVAWRNTYDLPFDSISLGDFYSITQLRVAWDDNLRYRVCTQIDNASYNITPNGIQKGKPYITRRISFMNPRFSFFGYNKIKIFPTPKKDVTNGISLTFNYFLKDVSLNTNEEQLNLPRYFLDVINKYLSYKFIKAENIELANSYYQEFQTTLHDNIYWFNRDQSPVEEEFWDFTYFTHN